MIQLPSFYILIQKGEFMTNPYVKDIVAKIPFEPGIYMMKDEKGEIIYVGKGCRNRYKVKKHNKF